MRGVRSESGEKRARWLNALVRYMEHLAGGKVNDAVKLAFLDGERMDEIDNLDLSALTEFKRSGNGTVEIKLMDRMAVLEKIAAMLERGEEGEADAFLRALERAGDQGAGRESGGEAMSGRGE